MKIVHILPGKANPHRMNGVNRIVHDLAEAMHNHGDDVEVWGLTKTPYAPTIERNYELRVFGSNPRSFFFCPELKKSLKSLSSRSIVHFHGVFVPAYFRCAKLLRQKNIAWIISPQGALSSASLQKKKFLKYFFIKAFDNYILCHAHRIHATTCLEKIDVKKWTSNDIVVVANALKHQEYARDCSSHNLQPIFGYIGRLEQRQKGLDILLEGFAIYKKSGGSGQLWLVGDGPDRFKLERQTIRLNIQQNIKFWGSCYGDQKTDLLQKMDVFTHPSRWEGMPMSLLEAAAYGKPLLVSAETGLDNAVKKWQAGYVLTNNCPSSLSDCMQLFESSHKKGSLNDIGKNSKRMIQEEYSLEKNLSHIRQTLYGL